MTEISIKIPAPTKPSGKAAMVMLGTGFDEIEGSCPGGCNASCRDGSLHSIHD